MRIDCNDNDAHALSIEQSCVCSLLSFFLLNLLYSLHLNAQFVDILFKLQAIISLYDHIE